MASDDCDNRATFSDELSSLIDRHTGELSSVELSDVLDEYSEVLASGGMTPTATLQSDSEPYVVELRYGSAIALEREMSNLLEIQGICIELERDLPALAEMRFEVCIDGLDDSVEIQGRPVSKTAAGTAIQVSDVDSDTREQLEALPGRARQASAKDEPDREVQRSESEPMTTGGQSSAAIVEPSSSERESDASLSGQPKTAAVNPRPARKQLTRDEPFEAEQWSELDVRSFREALIDTALRPGLWIVDVDSAEFRVQMLVARGKLRDIRRFPRPRTDRLEILLEKAGKLEESDVKAIRSHVEDHGGGAAEALLECAIMDVNAISVAESTRLRFLLERVWDIEPKRIRIAELNRLPRPCLAPARHALEFAFHLLYDEALERDDLLTECRDRLGDKTFRVSETPPFDLKVMSLTAKQKSTIEALSRDALRLDDALRMAVLPRNETLALLWALDELNLLDAQTVKTWTRQQSRSIERISLMHRKLDRSSHFDILGVHWSAFDDEIEDAYDELRARVGEDIDNEDLPEEVRDQAQAVLDRLDEAYETLSHSQRRATYRKEVVDPFQLRTSVQMFEKQADTAKMRRDIGEAIDFYKRILELKPGHAAAKRDLEMLEQVRRDRDKSTANES